MKKHRSSAETLQKLEIKGQNSNTDGKKKGTIFIEVFMVAVVVVAVVGLQVASYLILSPMLQSNILARRLCHKSLRSVLQQQISVQQVPRSDRQCQEGPSYDRWSILGAKLDTPLLLLLLQQQIPLKILMRLSCCLPYILKVYIDLISLSMELFLSAN